MDEPTNPPRRLPGDLLSFEDRCEYESLLQSLTSGGVVPLRATCELATRIKRDLQYRYIPGRDRYADAEWLITRELYSIGEILAYYAGHRRLRAVRQVDDDQLRINLDLDQAA